MILFKNLWDLKFWIVIVLVSLTGLASCSTSPKSAPTIPTENKPSAETASQSKTQDSSATDTKQTASDAEVKQKTEKPNDTKTQASTSGNPEKEFETTLQEFDDKLLTEREKLEKEKQARANSSHQGALRDTAQCTTA